MKNKKEQFIRAVRLLAPRNSQLLKLALRVPEAGLPAFPGGAALEFVAAFEKLVVGSCHAKTRRFRPSIPSRHRCAPARPSGKGFQNSYEEVAMAA
jgi:hypothetical protein